MEIGECVNLFTNSGVRQGGGCHGQGLRATRSAHLLPQKWERGQAEDEAKGKGLFALNFLEDVSFFHPFNL